MKSAWSVVAKILLRTVLRFNPLYQPVVPALVTMNLLAVVFTILYIRDKILCTFIIEYREIMLSAWGFVLLMNFLEELMDAIYTHDDEDSHE
jgi:hypothetical protein